VTDLENLDKPELRELARENDLHVDFRRSLPDVRAAIAEGLAAKAEGGADVAADPIVDVDFEGDGDDGGDEVGAAGAPGDGDAEGGADVAAAPSSPPRPVEYFKVLRKTAVASEGYVYTLPQGTVISSITHDIGALIRQGVPLEPVSGPPPAPAPW